MEILRHRRTDKYIQKYECHCNCGCEFIAEHGELESMEKCIDGRIWFKCPECGEVIEPIDRKGWVEKIIDPINLDDFEPIKEGSKVRLKNIKNPDSCVFDGQTGYIVYRHEQNYQVRIDNKYNFLLKRNNIELVK